MRKYPLELVFRERIGDHRRILEIGLTIRAESGQVVLHAASHGPRLRTDLPNGRYTVEVKWDAWTFSSPVTVRDAPQRVVFSWLRGASTDVVGGKPPEHLFVPEA